MVSLVCHIARNRGAHFVPTHGANIPLKLPKPNADACATPFTLCACRPKEKPAGHNDWEMAPDTATWTYKLMRLVRARAIISQQRKDEEVITAHVKGPYGSPFSKCFSRAYPAAVVIGAGTGLTSALSVLKEVLKRKSQKYNKDNATPQFVWFVWACRSEADLDWCWRTLQTAIFDAVKSNALKMGEEWSPLTSNMLE